MQTDPIDPAEPTPLHAELPPAEEEPEYIPAVLPVPATRPRRPQPHFGWALLWNAGFIIVLFGTIFGVLFVTGIVLALQGRAAALKATEEGTLPRVLTDALAVSMPI